MGIDYSYPNREAIDALGILTKYDEEHHEERGWARSVIDRIEQDLVGSQNPRTGISDFDRDDYDADELALYDWYREDVIDSDSWDSIRENAEVVDESTQGGDIAVGTMPEDYQPPAESPFVPPETSEYTGGEGGSHSVVYSREAINHFVKQIDQFARSEHDGILTNMWKELEKIEMLPGGFTVAQTLRTKIEGSGDADPGLRGDLMGLINTLQKSLFLTRQGLIEIRDTYDKSEEINTMSAKDLDKFMEGAWGQIGTIQDYGNGQDPSAP